MSTAPNTATIDQLRRAPALVEQDVKIDLFSQKGFELACRIGKAFASSDAVPAQFRLQVTKKDKNGTQIIDNDAALGNCIVAIETAQAVGMSVTAVMQNANVIEGKLSWSAQFVIAAVNASRRFTPLRFDMKNLGPIEATYREKLGWNKDKGGFDFAERKVTVDNWQCIAWALPADCPFPPGVYTLDQAKAKGLPVIESAPVTMKLAVEEGWYSKPGSKWQTEMKALMLQYRAGAFFGRIHAPDVVMGMGRTSEEEHDIIDVTPQRDGSYAVNLGDIPPAPAAAPKAAPKPEPTPEAKPADTAPASTEPPAQPAAEAKPAAGAPPGDLVDAAQDAETSRVEPQRQRRAPRAPINAD